MSGARPRLLATPCMALPRLAFNPDARISSLALGHDASPVVIIDDALMEPQAIAAYGRTEAAFAPPVTAYPGLNAPVPEAGLAPLIDGLMPRLTDIFGIPQGAQVDGRGYFGLVTLRPEDLTPGQSIPHVDNIGDRGLAAVIYLCDEDQGGTGFYRHRSSGFERLTRDNIALYNSVLDFETRRPPARAYPVGEHALFERIGEVAARFNRLAVYPCNLLHSGQVNPAKLSADPAKGRLTLNLFMG